MDLERFKRLVRLAHAIGLVSLAEIEHTASALDAALSADDAREALGRLNDLIRQRVALRRAALAEARRQRNAGYN